MLDVVSRPQKRLFLALMLASLLIATLSVYGLWKVSVPGLQELHVFLPWIFGGFLGLFGTRFKVH